MISDDGVPFRVGYALGNEFSDHIMERQNYLYLAHSKLRNCSFGPELLIGDLPGNVQVSNPRLILTSSSPNASPNAHLILIILT